MPDDPLNDRSQYDETANVAPLCPACRCQLKFCDPLGFPENCNWWCPCCEDFFSNKELDGRRSRVRPHATRWRLVDCRTEFVTATHEAEFPDRKILSPPEIAKTLGAQEVQ